jgi:hypothetical protein
VSEIIEGEGYLSANFFDVSGKADTDPEIPDDPAVVAKRRQFLQIRRHKGF